MEPLTRKQPRFFSITIVLSLLLCSVVAGVVWYLVVRGPTNKRGSPSLTTPEAKEDRPGTTAWRVIEPYCEAVSIYDGRAVFLRGFEQLPEPTRHLLAVWWCDAEVCNGGFHQFFSNFTGVLAPEAAQGFRAVGLAECADLLENAMVKFGEPYPRDRAARRAALEALKRPGQKRSEWDPFGELDKRYYAARDRLGFERTIDDYARRSAR